MKFYRESTNNHRKKSGLRKFLLISRQKAGRNSVRSAPSPIYFSRSAGSRSIARQNFQVLSRPGAISTCIKPSPRNKLTCLSGIFLISSALSLLAIHSALPAQVGPSGLFLESHFPRLSKEPYWFPKNYFFATCNCHIGAIDEPKKSGILIDKSTFRNHGDLFPNFTLKCRI